MWIKEAEYREQPEIHYKNTLLVQMQGTALGSTIVWSSFPIYNFLAQSSLRVPNVKVCAPGALSDVPDA